MLSYVGNMELFEYYPEKKRNEKERKEKKKEKTYVVEEEKCFSAYSG